jgi:thymidylate kinase
MHFGRPEGDDDRQRALFQKGTFDRMFRFVSALEGQDARVVMDRSHLGEYVYGPMYRPNSGVDLSYLWQMEDPTWDDVYLVLLRADPEILRARDDGLGFDINRLEEEQERFAEAFSLSRLRHKIAIDVSALSLEEVASTVALAIGLPHRQPAAESGIITRT